MESMQQSIDKLVEYISQSVGLTRRLEKNKCDPALVKLAFAQVDNKRKGFLDLANVYQLCGEVSQDELFIIFKWLDTSKKGDISYEDFEYALAGKPQTQDEKNQQTDPISAVKQCISVYLENWDFAKGSREKFGINAQNLCKIFRSICQSVRKSSITVDELIAVLSQSKKFDSHCKQEVKSLFRSQKVITEKIFLQKFQVQKEVEVSSSLPVRPTYQSNDKQNQQQQLLNEANKQSPKAKRSPPTFQIPTIEQVNQFIKDRYPKSLLADNRFNTETNRQQLREQGFQRSSAVDPKTGDIEGLLTNIQRRREQLQKGSLERKKLIEQALSRKRTNISPMGTPRVQQSENLQVMRSYTRPLSTPKPSSYSQNYISNFVDMPKTDLNKMFNKYRQQRQNTFSYTESKLNSKKYDEEMSYRAYGRTEMKNNHVNVNTSVKFQERMPLNFDQLENRSQTAIDWREETFRTGVHNNYVIETPKFSQTSQQRFFDRTTSMTKADRILQIREKLNYLPDKTNVQSPKKQPREIDFIIEKYRNYKQQLGDYTRKSDQAQRAAFSSYLMTQSPSNIRGVDINAYSSQRKGPDSYISDQKVRQTGVISPYRSPNAGTAAGVIQKENLLKRAQQQAARKIQEIQRKAKLKVLQRKSAVGLKWVK